MHRCSRFSIKHRGMCLLSWVSEWHSSTLATCRFGDMLHQEHAAIRCDRCACYVLSKLGCSSLAITLFLSSIAIESSIASLCLAILSCYCCYGRVLGGDGSGSSDGDGISDDHDSYVGFDCSSGGCSSGSSRSSSRSDISRLDIYVESPLAYSSSLDIVLSRLWPTVAG